MRIRELDGLRGIAILVVVAYHYGRGFTRSGAQFGWLGVNLFFILSGFLITSILVKLKGSDHFFSIFYKRRALRIFPLYYIALGIYIAAGWYTHQTLSAATWASYFFYYSSLVFNQSSHVDNLVVVPIQLGLGVLWSLSVEEIFYTLWAPVVRWTSQRVFILILLAVLVTAPVLRWILHTPNYLELFTFYCRMDGLALGSLVALAVIARRKSESIMRMDRMFDRLTAAAAVICIGFWIVTHGDKTKAIVSSIGVGCVDIFFALAVYACIRKAGGASWWLRALRAKWLRSIGGISYSLYLIHYSILAVISIQLIHLGFSRRWTIFTHDISALFLSIVLSYLIKWLIENPIEHWKQKHIPTDAVV